MENLKQLNLMKIIRLDIPNYLLEVLLKNPTGKKKDRVKSDKVEEFISIFLKTPEAFKVPETSFFSNSITELRKSELKNNFSFKVCEQDYEFFQNQSLVNLRTEKMQGLYMMVVIYYHLINLTK